MYVRWFEDMLNVSVDAEFAVSEFCSEEYSKKELQQDLERKEHTSYYAFVVDFQNGSIWNEYSEEKADRLYQSLRNSENPPQTASEQFRNNGRFECGAPDDMPRPPETTTSG